MRSGSLTPGESLECGWAAREHRAESPGDNQNWRRRRHARLRTERPRHGGRALKGVETFRSRACSPVPKASA